MTQKKTNDKLLHLQNLHDSLKLKEEVREQRKKVVEIISDKEEGR